MKKKIYLALAILGIILPYTQFVPWSRANGFDLRLMGAEMFANQIAAGIAIDALLVGLAIIMFIVFDANKAGVRYAWIPIVGIFLFGVSFSLPCYLFLREQASEKPVV